MTDEQRVQDIAEKVAHKALGISWTDTEAQARRVAEQAGEDIHAAIEGIEAFERLVEQCADLIEDLARVVEPLAQEALEPEDAKHWAGRSEEALAFTLELRKMLAEGLGSEAANGR